MSDHDPVSTEIHRKGIENIVNEMALTLVRTSGSPVVTDAKDFSTCLLDEAGEQLGISSYILLHSATARLNTEAVIAQLADDGSRPYPGDGWIVNDPYSGSQHQGDMGVVMPTFYRDEHVGWAFANVHVLDIGGMGVSGSAPDAVSVFDEALRFAGTRIIRDGRLDAEWKRYIAHSVRTPGPVLQDLRSMIAANNVAQHKLVELVDRFGLDEHRQHNERNKQLTEELLRRRIEAMPDGRYDAVEYVEFDARGPDELIEIRCQLEVSGSQLRFTFTGDPQVDAPVNGTRGTVYGGVMTHLVTMLAYGDLPFNAGMWRPLTIDLGPDGTIVNARPPAPVSMGHGEAAFRCGKAARHVLNQAASLSSDAEVRGRVGGIASDGFAGMALFGHDEAGRPGVLIFQDTVTGLGGGAQTVTDGQDMYGCCCTAGGGIPDVELHEAIDPVLFLWRRIAQNSGGPGQRRGGQGLDQAYLLRGGSSFAGFATLGCSEFPPPGAGGGLPPATALQYPIRATRQNGGEGDHDWHPFDEPSLGGTMEMIGIKVGKFVLDPDDVLRAIGGGGAGLGDPLVREPERVAGDVRDGYITSGHGKAAYAVILDSDGNLDREATERCRFERLRARLGKDPQRRAAPPDVAGLSIALDEGEGRVWRCAYCQSALSSADEDWRAAAVRHEVPIADLFAQLDMRVRERTAAPAIGVAQFYCPSCAGCLATDVVTENADPRSPVLAASQVERSG